jgi:competence protein ComEA
MRNSLLLLGMLALLSPTARAEKLRLEGVVNLNTASPEELRLIPGVGPARVRNILAYRHAHPFRSVDELARIKGIGRKTVRQWRLHLAVGGPSTAQRVIRADQPIAVGATALGVIHTSPPLAKPSLPARPPVRPAIPSRLVSRKGEPAHAAAHRSPGNHCLSPR